MMTVNEVSRLTGVSIRTLQYYDRIGLLPPTAYTEAGYRLYDETALERLQQILLFRELQFPLKEIREIIGSPAFDRSKALGQQIELLKLKKEHIENLIDLAEGLRGQANDPEDHSAAGNRERGVRQVTFEAFDTKKMDEYAAQAKASWGNTPAYREYEEKSRGRSREESAKIGEGLMAIFDEFGAIRGTDPAAAEAQVLVKRLQDYITEHMYTCTKEILCGLGTMYAGGGDFTVNIDARGGEGTAEFAHQAIEVYCR